MKTDLGWGGQHSESRAKVTAAKGPGWGGMRVGWTGAGREGWGRSCTPGSLKTEWTEVADRPDMGVREREEAR